MRRTRRLFRALEDVVNQTSARQLIRTPHSINDPAFAALVVQTYRSLHGSPREFTAGGAWCLAPCSSCAALVLALRRTLIPAVFALIRTWRGA